MARRLLALLIVLSFAAETAALASGNISKARGYFIRDHVKSFHREAKKFPPDHVFAPLLAYWSAVLSLRQHQFKKLETVAQNTQSDFLRERALNLLGVHYAKHKRWDDLARLSAQLPACGQILSQLHHGESPNATQVLRQWRQDKKLNDSLCLTAYKKARQMGILQQNDVWHKMQELAGSRKLSATRRLLRHFPLPIRYQDVRRVANRPQHYIRGKHSLRTPAQRALVMIAAMAAARSHPTLAIARWQKFSRYFNKRQNAQVWAAIAEWAARWHHAEAMALYQVAAPAAALSNSQRAWRVRAALRDGDFADIAKTIAAMPQEQASLSTWRYWQAVALGETDDLAQGQKLMRQLAADEDDYYGLLAREEMNLPLVTVADSPPQQAVASGDFSLALAAHLSGQHVLARKIWRHALRHNKNTEEVLAAAQTAAAAAWYLASIEAADRLSQAHALRFPRPYHDVIDKYSAKFDLDKAFVYGLIRQESRFMRTIVSSAKAQGLMQVMPSTAGIVAKSNGYSRYHLSRLMRADTNVIIGTTYLDELARDFSNHPVQVAAAYNAGPSRPARWLRRNGKRDILVYVENIPILETRLYVKRVLANRVHYAARLGHERASMREWVSLPIRNSLSANLAVN